MPSSRRERPPQGRTNMDSARRASTPSIPGKVDKLQTIIESARRNDKIQNNDLLEEKQSANYARPTTTSIGKKTTPMHITSARPQTVYSARTQDLFAKEPKIDWNIPSKNLMHETRRIRMLKPGELVDGAEKYARPRPCFHAPLKSVFLDPKANTFPNSKTKNSLMKKIRNINIPHESYDIDGDGVVDQDDMKFAKKFDVNGTGVLSAKEQLIGKRMLSEEFFSSNKKDLHLYSDEFLKNTEEDNVKNLTSSHAFTETFNAIKLKRQSLRNYSSERLFSCMKFPAEDLIKYNFYNDKFDATAWSDYGAMPRKVAYKHHDDIRGSRERMNFLRKMRNRDYCAGRLESAEDNKPKFSTKKIGLITNFSKYAN